MGDGYGVQHGELCPLIGAHGIVSQFRLEPSRHGIGVDLLTGWPEVFADHVSDGIESARLHLGQDALVGQVNWPAKL